MSKKSMNSSVRKTIQPNPETPFDKAVFRKARNLVGKYRLTLEKHPRLGFVGSSIELPNVFAHAETYEKCCEGILEALTVAAATMIESGQHPPQPASARKRTAQVNVRLTSEEKITLLNAAQTDGFKGISDFMRSAAIHTALTVRQ